MTYGIHLLFQDSCSRAVVLTTILVDDVSEIIIENLKSELAHFANTIGSPIHTGNVEAEYLTYRWLFVNTAVPKQLGISLGINDLNMPLSEEIICSEDLVLDRASSVGKYPVYILQITPRYERLASASFYVWKRGNRKLYALSSI